MGVLPTNQLLPRRVKVMPENLSRSSKALAPGLTVTLKSLKTPHSFVLHRTVDCFLCASRTASVAQNWQTSIPPNASPSWRLSEASVPHSVQWPYF